MKKSKPGKNNVVQKKNNQPFFDFKIRSFLLFLYCFFLPTQLGKHFFPDFAFLSGIRIDYLAPTIYVSDILAALLIVTNFKTVLVFFKKKFFFSVFLFFLINFTFALSKPLFIYRFVKVIEVLAVFSLFRDYFFNHKKACIAGFSLSVFFQTPLILLQLLTKHSQQGFWYFFGERYFTLSSPGIAKATVRGIEMLRPYGTFSHPNSMGGYFLLIFFFFLTSKHITNNLIKYSALFLCSFLILFSFSKNALLVYLLLNTIYWIRTPSPCRICNLTRLVSPLLLGIVFLTAQTDILSFQKRITLIIESLTIIFQHLFVGVGLGSYLIAELKFPIKYPYFFLQPVHNIFLLFIAEMGPIIGLILLIQLGMFIRKYMRNKNTYFIILAIVLTGLSDHYWITLQQNLLLMPTLLGMMLYNEV